MREWDRSPFGGRGPGASPAADAPTERLTVGRATIAIAPVTDRDRLDDLLGGVARVPGLSGIRVESFEDGEAQVVVTARHPVLLADQLRRALDGRVRSCTPAGPSGRVVVDAREPAPPAPEPDPAAPGEAPPAAPDDADTPEPAGEPGTAGATTEADGDAETAHGDEHAAAEDAAAVDPVTAGVVTALTATIDETPGLAVLVFDTELRVTAVAGVPPEAGDGRVLVGRPVVQAFPAVARRLVSAALAGALGGEERTVALPGDDGQVQVEVTCRPVDGGGGVCVIRDLATRGAGTLLVEATRAFEITFRHSPIGQGLLSGTGRWLRVNGALAELLGRPADALVGGEAVESMHPDDRSRERERLSRLVGGEDDHYVVGTRFMHADGHVVRTHTRMTRIADDEGAVRGFVAQVVDAAAWRRFRG